MLHGSRVPHPHDRRVYAFPCGNRTNRPSGRHTPLYQNESFSITAKSCGQSISSFPNSKTMTLSLNQVQITSDHARGVTQVLKRSSWGHQRSKIKLESFCHLWNQTEPNNDRLQDDSISITQNDFYGFYKGWLIEHELYCWVIVYD